MTVKLDFPYLVIDTDRHGNERLYIRRHGRKIRIREKPGTRPFTYAYNAALDALEHAAPQVQPERRNAPAGTFGCLAATYFASVEFKALPPSSQGMRRGIIESCLQEPLRPGSKDKVAMVPIVLLEAKHLRMLRDRRADKPGAANNRLKYLSVMLSWAVERT